MEPIKGSEAASRVTGMMSPKHQVHGFAVDLSVRNIFALDPVGQVDFGGGEYRAAGRVPVAPQQRSREDKYMWWELDRGAYFVEFNEALDMAADEMALLEPDDRLLRAGASHIPVYLRGRVTVVEALLVVSALRVSVKQNARVSHIRLFKMLPAAKAPALTIPDPEALARELFLARPTPSSAGEQPVVKLSIPDPEAAVSRAAPHLSKPSPAAEPVSKSKGKRRKS